MFTYFRQFLLFSYYDGQTTNSNLISFPETSLLNDELKSRNYNDKIDEILRNSEIDKFYSKLEMYFSNEEDAKFYTNERNVTALNDTAAKDQLHNALNSFKSSTAKEEFLRRIRYVSIQDRLLKTLIRIYESS